MTRPVPLMFIKSPSASVRLPDKQEESRFALSEEETVEDIEVEQSDKQEVPSLVEEQLKKIQSPFGRHLYQPLLFKLTNQKEIIGTMKEVEDNRLIIMQDGDGEKEILLKIDEIADIIWRGKSLGE